ncbi:MAG: hypothetical protein ACRES8_01620 [Nevskiaceae bacterium]
MTRCIVLLLMALCAATGAVAAEPQEGDAPAAAPAPATETGEARAYLGFGLLAASHTLSSPLGDFDSSGGGLIANGVGHSRPLNPSLDIAFRGEVALMGREFDGGGPETADVLFEVDGGLRISQMLLLTLGYTTQVIAYDSPEVAVTYNVIPIGVGILHTTDSGYVLAQLRVGGGRLGNDQNDDTESVGYAGIRAVVQHGFGSGVQFMLGLGLDNYEIDDTGEEEQFFRLEFGLGFGI